MTRVCFGERMLLNLFDDETYNVDSMFDKVGEHACTCVRRSMQLWMKCSDYLKRNTTV